MYFRAQDFDCVFQEIPVRSSSVQLEIHGDHIDLSHLCKLYSIIMLDSSLNYSVECNVVLGDITENILPCRVSITDTTQFGRTLKLKVM